MKLHLLGKIGFELALPNQIPDASKELSHDDLWLALGGPKRGRPMKEVKEVSDTSDT